MAGEFKVGTVRGDMVLGTADWDKSIQQATLGLGVISGALLLVGKKAVSMASKFEIGMKEVATMLDATGKKKLPEFSSAMKKMMTEFGEPVDKLQRGLYDILSAGIDASKAIDVLTASTKLAKAGVTDTAVATDALTTIINSYALSAEQASDVSDLLFAIVKRGKTTMGALAPSIGRVASLAASSGLSLNEMGASLATMTRAGLQTQEAITALRGITVSFLKPTKEAEKVAAEFGIELSANTLRTEGLGGVMKKLTNATEAQRASIFPNIRALAGMSAMLQNTEGFMEDLDLMTKRTGATNEAFATIMDSSKIIGDKFKQTINALWIDLGEKLMPEWNKGVITATNFAKAILSMDEGTKIAIIGLGKMVFAVTGIGTVLGVGYLAVMKMKGAFIGLNKVLAISPIVAITTAIALLGKVALDVAGKIIDKNLAMATSYLEQQKAARASLELRIELLKKERDEISANLEAGRIRGDEALLAAENINRMTKAITFYEKQLAEQRIEIAKNETDVKIAERQRLNEQMLLDDMEYQATELAGYQEYQMGIKAMHDEYVTYEAREQANRQARFQAFSNSLASAWSGSMAQFILEGGKASAAIKNIWDDIRRYVVNMIAQMMAKWITFQVLTAGFGLGGGAVGKFMGFQHGVKNFGGGVALVGEGTVGGELVNLPRGSDVIPAPETKKILNSKASPSITVILQALDPDSISESHWEKISQKIKTISQFEERR